MLVQAWTRHTHEEEELRIGPRPLNAIYPPCASYIHRAAVVGEVVDSVDACLALLLCIFVFFLTLRKVVEHPLSASRFRRTGRCHIFANGAGDV